VHFSANIHSPAGEIDKSERRDNILAITRRKRGVIWLITSRFAKKYLHINETRYEMKRAAIYRAAIISNVTLHGPPRLSRQASTVLAKLYIEKEIRLRLRGDN
jgi:hypothetical protein